MMTDITLISLSRHNCCSFSTMQCKISPAVERISKITILISDVLPRYSVASQKCTSPWIAVEHVVKVWMGRKQIVVKDLGDGFSMFSKNRH